MAGAHCNMAGVYIPHSVQYKYSFAISVHLRIKSQFSIVNMKRCVVETELIRLGRVQNAMMNSSLNSHLCW